MEVEEGAGWRTESLDLIILDLLHKREGTIKDNELLEMLKAMLRDFSAADLNKALMSLELRGKINVATQEGKGHNLAETQAGRTELGYGSEPERSCYSRCCISRGTQG